MIMSNFENYNDVSQNYDALRAPSGADVIAAMMQFHCGAPLKELHVLDAGCGTGNYAKALLDYGIGHVTLLDASRGMLSKAQDKMAEEISNGRVADVVEAKLPDMPFPDGKFDAVMINMVVHHLADKDSPEYPAIVATFQSARRVLRPNGLLLITTVLPALINHVIWYTRICSSLTERFIKLMPTEKHFSAMFQKSGFRCITSLNIHGDKLLNDYYNFEGPLNKTWLASTSYWTCATEAEMKEIEDKIRDLKDSGKLTQWATERDHVDTCGLVTLFVSSAV